jgi:hypothetical protein
LCPLCRVDDLKSGKTIYSSSDVFRDRWCEIFDASPGLKCEVITSNHSILN